MLRLAHVIPYWHERYGGPVQVVRSIGRHLHERGVEVSYWTTGERSEFCENELEQAHICEPAFPRSWYYSRNFKQELAGYSPLDVMHIHELWPYTSFAAAGICSRRGIPYVLSPHGTLSSWSLRQKGIKKQLYLSLIGRRLMRSAACLHATTPIEAEAFRRTGYSGPIVVVPNGVNADEFAEIPPREEADALFPALNDRRVVLFLSRLSPEKGLDLLIPAAAALFKMNKLADVLLVIAGPNDRAYAANVVSMISALGIENRVILLGMVTGRAKLALYSRAEIFVLPSYTENFGLVVAEALACQTPVLTTTGTPWHELNTLDAGRCVPPDRQSIQTALQALMEMPRERLRQMGTRGRQLVMDRYTWQSATDRLLDTYRSVVAGRLPV